MSRSRIVKAGKLAGCYVISKADSDGLMGVRNHPWYQLARMCRDQATPIRKLGAAWFWLKKYAYLYRQEDEEVLESLRQADALWLECAEHKKRLGSFLASYGMAYLADKIHGFHNAVAYDFLSGSPMEQRPRKIIAIGRWDAPQKNGHLLAPYGNSCRSFRTAKS